MSVETIQFTAIPSYRQSRLMERHIGTNSRRHGEYYLRLSGDEIWYLAPHLVGQRRVDAIRSVREGYGLSRDQAEAAYLFCRYFPETAQELIRRHNDWPEGERRAQFNPQEILSLRP